MFNLVNRGELQATTEHEFENHTSRLKGLWLIEHNEDGSHQTELWGFADEEHSHLKAEQDPQTAYKDEANTFTQNQLISKTRPEVKFLHSGTSNARIAQYLANSAVWTTNAYYDGTDWNLDNTSLPGLLLVQDPAGGFGYWLVPAGANPRTSALINLMGLNTAGLITLSGGQILFPATQIASANANTLDDYEEGTWTPALNFGGASVGITYSVQTGGYTKIGNTVNAWLAIILTSKGSSTGAATITGLPFTEAGFNPNGVMDTPVGFTTPNSPFCVMATTTWFPCYTVAGGVRAQMLDTHFANNSQFSVNITYRI